MVMNGCATYVALCDVYGRKPLTREYFVALMGKMCVVNSYHHRDCADLNVHTQLLAAPITGDLCYIILCLVICHLSTTTI